VIASLESKTLGTRRAVGLVIAHGPEVRAMVYSGLAEALKNVFGRVVVFVIGEQEIQVPEEIELRQIQDMGLSRILHRMRMLNDRLHDEWLKRGNHGDRWRHQVTVPPKFSVTKSVSLELLSSLDLARAVCRGAERLAVRRRGTNHRWKSILQAADVSVLVTTGYSSPRLQPAIHTAWNLGIPVIALTNSWKDVHVRRRVPNGLDILGVWNEDLAADARIFNPRLGADQVQVTGSLHLAGLKAVTKFPDRREFCESHGLDPGLPVVCYSAAAPNAVVDEGSIVGRILHELRSGENTRNYQVLIRSNPMGGADRFDALTGAHSGVAVQMPRWSWDPIADWCAPDLEDLTLWRAVIEHSIANISIPSTVTLEFALFRKPVVNVVFDAVHPEEKSSSNHRFWDAPFYYTVRRWGLAVPAETPAETAALVSNIAEDDSVPRRRPKLPGNAVADVAQLARMIAGTTGQ